MYICISIHTHTPTHTFTPIYKTYKTPHTSQTPSQIQKYLHIK